MLAMAAVIVREELHDRGFIHRWGSGFSHLRRLLSAVEKNRKRSTDPERALVSDIPAIPALGYAGMFSPNLVPEEILNDHPERMRAVIVECLIPRSGSPPI